MPSSFQARRVKLIQRGLQLRLTAKFVGVAVLAMAMQFLFLGYRLLGALEEVESRGGDLAQEVPSLLLQTLGLSMIVVLPALVALGILLTFPIAGPVYRFEQFLKSVAKGEATSPCKIRKGDELSSLCELLNEVTEPLLEEAEAPQEQEAA